MKQYKELLQAIKNKGTYKAPAREGMPGTTSLFGYQFRHNLQEGFPAITTKKLYWKGVVGELLWFLRGDTNIKFLDKLGITKMWHEDAYNYYVKKCNEQNLYPVTFDDFCRIIKEDVAIETLESVHGGVLQNYELGDCGMQYGKLWRNWEGVQNPQVLSIRTDRLTNEQLEEFREKWQQAMQQSYPNFIISRDLEPQYLNRGVDQIKELIEGLKNNPMSRRHIITAWNPATLDDMALNACHAFVQFNCRPLTHIQRNNYCKDVLYTHSSHYTGDFYEPELNEMNVPKYYLDCQMYQRSADVFLGVPLNIASYALLTHIIAEICNMIPGDYIHTFGDVHIYDNHQKQVEEQLSREERDLPQLLISPWFRESIGDNLEELIFRLDLTDFVLDKYDPHPTIEAELSTGLKK